MRPERIKRVAKRRLRGEIVVEKNEQPMSEQRSASNGERTKKAEPVDVSRPRVAEIASDHFELPRDERALSVLVSSPARDINVSGPWEVGQTVDGLYEVKEILGHGGMGIVYRVHHLNWRIDLAVKCVREGHKADDEIMRAFLHEADKWIHLGLHPNVVSAYYVRKYGDGHYIFLEYVPGVSLRTLLESHEKPTFQQKLDMAIQICRGLAHCHKKGMIHRDIKLENILVARSDETDLFDAKLTDFGLVHQRAARVAGVKASLKEEQILAGWGTPRYMAPELFDDARAISESSDVYALSITLYELFGGQHPLGEHKPENWPEAHREVNTEPLRSLKAAELAEMLRNGLAKLPGRRPPLKELVEVLLQAYDEAPGII